MTQKELILSLEVRLTEPLPGTPAHNKMKPLLANGIPIRFPERSDTREGGVLILLYEKNNTIHFPLIRRSEYEGVHSGQIALPGGRYEASDSNLIDTALRETEEEIGIDRSTVSVIGQLSKFYVGASNYNILPVVGYLKEVPEFRPDLFEVAEVIEAKLEVLLNPENVKTKTIRARNAVELTSPYFDIQDQTVWGATAMMLSEFSEILKELYNA